MRVIVCGGRDLEDAACVFGALDKLDADERITAVVHGGARGADSLADLWAKRHSIPVEVFTPDWQHDGRRADPKRNQRMVNAGADRCMAFPGGHGTPDLMRRAQIAGIDVFVLW